MKISSIKYFAFMCLCLFGVTGAYAETVDFEAFASGDTVSTIATTAGNIAVFGTNPNSPSINYARVFDTSNPFCDPDLGTPNAAYGGPGQPEDLATNNEVALGNVLIIQDSSPNCFAGPDDIDVTAQDGVKIEFDFGAIGTVSVDSISFLDIDGNGPDPRIELFDAFGDVIAVFAIPQTIGNGVVTVDISTANVALMTIWLQGSGAMTGFDINGDQPTASLGDFVWNDVDRDGLQDPGEPGIDGVGVTLTNCGDSSNPANVLGTTTTSNGGLYLFDNLNAGSYCVEFDRTSAAVALNCDAVFSPSNGPVNDPNNSDADPTTGKTSAITLAAGEDNRNVDAGLSCPPQLLGSIGDFVWEDLNADGVQDANEAGIDGVTVNLLDPGVDGNCGSADDGFITQTMTMNGGAYLFDNLEESSYCVQFVKDPSLMCEFGDVEFSPSIGGINVVDNSDADTTTGFTSAIGLGAGENNPNVDAGLYCPAKLGDFVWEDTDRDGIQDPGEDGIPGVTVTLLACDANGNTSAMGTATTGPDGMYMFSPLTPGDYAVSFDAPDGFVFSPANAGGDDNVDSDADTATGQTMCMPLVSNQNDPTRDAGLYPAPLSGLGDRVWEDKNANGAQDPGEPGVPGATVTLLLPGADNQCNTVDDDVTSSTAITDSNGEYMFEGLFPGRYCVAFDTSTADLACLYGDGPVFTLRDATGDTADSDASPTTGKTGNIDLGLQEYDPTNDAGIYCPAKLGDRVWKDENANGLQDDGEVGVDGVEVNLFACDANGDIVNGSIATILTSGGMYMFSDLMPGSYAVQFIKPADLDFTLLNVGSLETVDSDADSAGFTECVVIESNEFDPTVDAGLIDPPDCGLGLVKTCEVITPPAPPLESCEGKIQSFTMIWTGGTTSIAGIDNDSGGTVVNGQEVTFSAPAGGWDGNDNFLTVGDGESVFHVSCSDDAMDGETDEPAFPADCGRLNGDGKGDDSEFINLWQFEGLTDDDGQVVDCTVEPPVPTSSCEFPATFASCDTLPDKPEMFSFLYTGGGCGASDNTQGDKFECFGSIAAGSTLTLSTSTGETIENVQPGQLVTIGKDGSETEIFLDDGAGGIETIVFHTSCSAPLITGEIYGSLTLAALDGQGSGKEVLYSYLISNDGPSQITGISVTDSEFGAIGTVPSLNSGDSTTLTAMSFISETTTNVATATGSGAGECLATAEATVTVLPPPPCTVTVAFKELKDDAIKYTVTNTGNRAASLDELTFDFPSDFVAIKEVKLDGGIYKSDDSPLVIEPGDTIGIGDWTKDDASKRVLDPGEDRTLEIKFEEKAKGFDPSADFNGTVKFNDGDCKILL